MNYTFTGPDVLMISLIVVIITMLVLHRPQQHQRFKSTCYKLGINAIRIQWGGGLGAGVHEIKIQLNRIGDDFPTVGDLLTFIETDQGTWVGQVEQIRLLPDCFIAGPKKRRPAAVITVVGK